MFVSHTEARGTYTFCGQYVSVLGSFLPLTWLCVLQKQATDGFISVIVALYSVTVILLDFESHSSFDVPSWPMFVILVDVLLVLECPMRMTFTVVATCLFWLLVLMFEDAFRFGFYDIEGTPNQSYRRGVCDCEKLPCSKGLGRSLAIFVTQILIFVLDFICTRGFAAAVLGEKNRILASIQTANLIAESLSRFDLESSATMLEEAEIPDDLRNAFSSILSNLRSYKPYLPQSVLCHFSDSDDDNVGESLIRSSNGNSTPNRSLSGSFIAPLDVCRPFGTCTTALLVVNVRNSLSVLEESQKTFKSLVFDVITQTSDIICKNKGTLDLFLGDRCAIERAARRGGAPMLHTITIS
eukprot:TRINITY_DN7799_c0_g2_i2.p1 TRINITY_DN7799_c0_g2~~TRINITY_DN7799_c0_g2_i2.p1  ORF type:complete len:354 (-),score=61.05 TRINITY_DN7799_c0_g2_i2:43-1104(-)